MNREDLHVLLEKYLNNDCSDEEKLLVGRLYGLLDNADLAKGYTDEQSDLEQKLWNNISQQSRLTHNHQHSTHHNRIRWYAAAVISAISLLTAYLFIADTRDPRYIAFQAYHNLVQKRNSSTALLTIKLEDGSKVVLQPASSLIYPAHFYAGQREVSLTGEGYFLISKNRKRPFFVYSKNVITRVIGTSFTVKTDKNTNQTEVLVRTGKVVVVPNEDRQLNLKQLFGNDATAILTPNQKTVYSADKRSFKTTLVPEPILIPHLQSSTQKIDVFEDTPVPEVFAALKQCYGIDIIIQDQGLNRNTFTGDISGWGLYKKIDLICRSMDAAYVISGTKIMIKKKR